MPEPASGNGFSWSPDVRHLESQTVGGLIPRDMMLGMESGRKTQLASGALVGQMAWLDAITNIFILGSRLIVKATMAEVDWDIGSYVNQLDVI